MKKELVHKKASLSVAFPGVSVARTRKHGEVSDAISILRAVWEGNGENEQTLAPRASALAMKNKYYPCMATAGEVKNVSTFKKI